MRAEMSKSPELEFMEKNCSALGMSLEELTVASLRSLFAHVYYIWRTFRAALGDADAREYYGNVWKELARLGFAQAMQAYSIKEVKDLPTLGRVVKFCFTGVPALYITKRDEKNEHVGHILWCANPAYGPSDNTYRRHDYYRQEVCLTYVYLWEIIQEAKKVGLEEEVLVELPSGRCRDGSAPSCQIVLRTRKANPDRPLPGVEGQYLDLEIGEQEPLIYILKKQNRTLEMQGPSSFIGFLAIDFWAWLQLDQNVKNRSMNIYLDLWKNFPPMWVKDARLDLEIGRAKTLQELSDIIIYCQKKKYVSYRVNSKTNSSLFLIATTDPFVEVAGMLGAPSGYMEGIYQMDQDFIRNIVKEAKMDKIAKVSFISHLAQGSSSSEIHIELR